MVGDSCIWFPSVRVGGEDKISNLYKELDVLFKHDRNKMNYIYAEYYALDVASGMRATGRYQADENGEYRAKDVLEYLGQEDFITDVETTLNQKSRQAGFKDNYGEYVNFTNTLEAYEKAYRYNSEHASTVATVVTDNNGSHIVLQETGIDTVLKRNFTESQYRMMTAFSNTLNRMRLNAEEVISSYRNLFNVTFINNLDNYFRGKKEAALNELSIDDIRATLTLSQNHPIVRNLIIRWGGIEGAAQIIFNELNGNSQGGQLHNLVVRGITDGLNKAYEIATSISNSTREAWRNTRRNSIESRVYNEYKDLVEKYKINPRVFVKENNEIKSIKDLILYSISVLNKEKRAIEAKVGPTEKVKELEKKISDLEFMVSNRMYLTGILSFLQDGITYMQGIERKINSLNLDAYTVEDLNRISDEYKNLKDLVNAYKVALESLLSIESILGDEGFDEDDIALIKERTNTARTLLKKQENAISLIRESVMLSIISKVTGYKTKDGLPLADLVALNSETSVFDKLRRWQAISNPLIGAAGKLVRDAQDRRDIVIEGYRQRIKAATEKLYKTTKNTRFMYESNGYIISKYDWDKFNRARAAAFGRFLQQRLYGAELELAMNQWVIDHTDGVVVDTKSGRTERVPNSNFWKLNPYDNLTPEEKEYYDTIMQIKGEIGTLLPDKARRQFLPPQRSRTLRQIVSDGFANKENAITVAKQLLMKVRQIVTDSRPDDSFYYSRGKITGEYFKNVEADYDGMATKEIPIYFINQLRDNQGNLDSSDLSKEFSSGVLALASTAANYACLNEVENSVNLMKDYISDVNNNVAKTNGVPEESSIANSSRVQVNERVLNGKAAMKNLEILQGFIDMQIYNENTTKDNWFVKFVRGIMNYSSHLALDANVKGAVGNELVGELQMLIAATGGEDYNHKDLLKARKQLIVDGGYFSTLFKGEDSKQYLLHQMFNPSQESFGSNMDRRFGSNAFERVAAGTNLRILYGSGEWIIHELGMNACLNHIKVRVNGEVTSLYDALTIRETNGVRSLVLPENTTLFNGDPLPNDFLDIVRRKIRSSNQRCHGAMNKEDYGIIRRNVLGMLAMQFRQWMIETYEQRYRSPFFDFDTGDWREGYWYTVYRLTLAHLFKNSEMALNANELTDAQKANLRKALGEVGIVLLLIILNGPILGGEEDDEDDEKLKIFTKYEVKRLLMEELAFTPTIIWQYNNFMNIIKTPIPSFNQVDNMFYLIRGLANGDVTSNYEKGRYKGENKYLVKLRKNLIPYYSQIDALINIDEDPYVYRSVSPFND